MSFKEGKDEGPCEAGETTPKKELIHQAAGRNIREMVARIGQLTAGTGKMTAREFSKEGIICSDKSQHHKASERRYGKTEM
jgi:hypothetical protein